MSQDCCPLCHAFPGWLWSGDCRYNVDCSQCVFKDQNNNGICSAHSLTLIDHLSLLSLPLWSHQLLFWPFLTAFSHRATLNDIFWELTSHIFSTNWYEHLISFVKYFNKSEYLKRVPDQMLCHIHKNVLTYLQLGLFNLNKTATVTTVYNCLCHYPLVTKLGSSLPR